ncbi:hypothetical protein BDE18_0934 [Paracoccus pantotrophus]|uniref:Uncharacterized protein n=1 Tax=Paracoccus pantotrophus TaxID=82367 RepID=A0ABX9SG07_PARPN|nr:hypothetical protein BDE18_0934 [Paracoccus pantotrophus]
MAFAARGTSLHAWCQESGVKMQNARASLLGQWRGPKAQQLIERILEAAERPHGCMVPLSNLAGIGPLPATRMGIPT